MMNQIGMKHHNSRRFDVPEPYEKRAQWFESLARWDPTADLLQQLIDFRRSAMRDNEAAYMRLVERGRQGDIGSTCLAAAIYQHFEPKVTEKWRLRFDDVAKAAMDVSEKGHPVCAGVEATLYLHGSGGVSRDPVKSKAASIKAALSGMYGHQMALALMHLNGAIEFSPPDVTLYMCWSKVADRHSTLSGFTDKCESYRHGIASNSKGEPAELPESTQKLAAQWCAPQMRVEPTDCARLEHEFEKGDHE